MEQVNLMRKQQRRWASTVWTLAIPTLVASLVAVGLSASPASAEPGCQNGGILSVFARGSQDGPPNFNSAESATFYRSLLSLLPSGMPFAQVDLGNLDNNGVLDRDHEYPAVGWADWGILTGMDGYYHSVNVGTAELANFLNRRYGPGGCASETVVLGGYSQGAEVVGYAVTGVSDAVLSHVGFVALYGDPRYYASCLLHNGSPGPWTHGSGGCGHGFLGERAPYAPSALGGRVGTWCDAHDGICTGNKLYLPIAGNPLSTHGHAYQDHWIADSATAIADAARDRVRLLTAPGTGYPIDLPAAAVNGSIIHSDEGQLYILAGGRLFWFDQGDSAQLNAFKAQDRQLTGTDVYINLDHNAVHALEVNRDSNGIYVPGTHMPADNTFLYQYGSTQQYVVKYEHPFAIGSQTEVTALGGQDMAVMVPPGLTDLQTHPAHWVENDQLQFGTDPSVWHYTGSLGYRVPSVPTRDCLSVRWSRGVTLMPASAWNYFPTNPTQQAACDFIHGQVLVGEPSGRQAIVLYNAGSSIGSPEEAIAIGAANKAAPVTDETVYGLLARSPSVPQGHIFRAGLATQAYQYVDGQMHYIGSPATRDCLLATNQLGTGEEVVPGSFIARFPVGAGAYCQLENRQLILNGSVVYIQNGSKRPVTNPAIRDCIAVRAGAGQPLAVSSNVWNQYTYGPNAFCPYPASIRFVQGAGQPEVWRVFPDGTRQHADGFCVSDPFTTNLEQFHVYVVPAGEVDGHALRDPPVFHASPENCAAIP
jgi:hypothetical protein